MYTMDDLLASFDELRALEGQYTRQRECSVGMYTDDPAAPGVTAIVFQGKLYSLAIPDAYLGLHPQMLADIINATVVNAFISCEEDRLRLAAERNGG